MKIQIRKIQTMEQQTYLPKYLICPLSLKKAEKYGKERSGSMKEEEKNPWNQEDFSPWSNMPSYENDSLNKSKSCYDDLLDEYSGRKPKESKKLNEEPTEQISVEDTMKQCAILVKRTRLPWILAGFFALLMLGIGMFVYQNAREAEAAYKVQIRQQQEEIEMLKTEIEMLNMEREILNMELQVLDEELKYN
jgi:hypothetical protein